MTSYQPQQYPPREVVRLPLSPGQHILHLILTLLTGGLWSIVWIWRAISGNKVWADTQPGYYRPPPPWQVMQYGPMPAQPYGLTSEGMVQRPRPQEPGAPPQGYR